MDIDLKELEKRFHADGYRIAMHAVRAGFSSDALFAALQELHTQVDEMIRSFFNHAHFIFLCFRLFFLQSNSCLVEFVFF